MKSSIALLLMTLLFGLNSCRNETRLKRNDFFKKGELHINSFEDSLERASFSSILELVNEAPLRDCRTCKAYRLTVIPFTYNPYTIRLDSTDFGIEVTIKIMGDREGFVRAGLKNLTLTYSGFDKNMDSLFSELKVLIEGSEFSPIYMKQKNFVIADGNSYLLEKFSYGQFKATANTYWLRDTTNVIKKFHLLVPPGILPDLEKARKVEDVLFPVFK